MIQSRPPNDAYRSGWERAFSQEVAPPTVTDPRAFASATEAALRLAVARDERHAAELAETRRMLARAMDLWLRDEGSVCRCCVAPVGTTSAGGLCGAPAVGVRWGESAGLDRVCEVHFGPRGVRLP